MKRRSWIKNHEQDDDIFATKALLSQWQGQAWERPFFPTPCTTRGFFSLPIIIILGTATMHALLQISLFRNGLEILFGRVVQPASARAKQATNILRARLPACAILGFRFPVSVPLGFKVLARTVRSTTVSVLLIKQDNIQTQWRINRLYRTYSYIRTRSTYEHCVWLGVSGPINNSN